MNCHSGFNVDNMKFYNSALDHNLEIKHVSATYQQNIPILFCLSDSVHGTRGLNFQAWHCNGQRLYNFIKSTLVNRHFVFKITVCDLVVLLRNKSSLGIHKPIKILYGGSRWLG